MTDQSALLLRPAAAGDEDALRMLAELDSAPQLPGPALLAVADGELVAAVSLADGSAIANPFRRTAGVLALLREHAGLRSVGLAHA
jgi:hypothetical protein